MTIVVNGNSLEISNSVKSVAELLQELKLADKSLIVEHNQNILTKEEHVNVSIKDGDRLEIVHFVGGG
ncbi:thiamine biosynthesis protein ThiS [Gracilibacillus halotolerans]|uniref:Thiamine biosynthesis protein ThiS n=1 Tax=Gracilibacillus halotolerans TaxID=74386 RepID=A0A841RL32_9BACI|nr:sulfur carrier protein ThiS [Gracilibacillus halotolerans]MBB6512652.1 thiamine biosynthesis protein ThiS [Gracilibacillus halotolerans]